MARARNIKPQFFHDAELVECDFWVRLLFAGLWTLADRDGRLCDKPKQIKMDLFPADAVDVDAGLNELAAHSFIVRYEAAGERYIEVCNFGKHQNPHRDERESAIPPPHEHSASTVQAPHSHGANRADSLNLIPDSPINDISSDASRSAQSSEPESAQCATVAQDFDTRFWRRYPKGRGVKKQALGQWRRLTPSERDAAAAGLDTWLACEQWQDIRFVVHAERWLRDRRWEDEPPPRGTGRESGGYRSQADINSGAHSRLVL